MILFTIGFSILPTRVVSSILIPIKSIPLFFLLSIRLLDLFLFILLRRTSALLLLFFFLLLLFSQSEICWIWIWCYRKMSKSFPIALNFMSSCRSKETTKTILTFLKVSFSDLFDLGNGTIASGNHSRLRKEWYVKVWNVTV